MSGFLRFVGIVNAAIWFGAGIVFTVVVLPAVFSQETHKLFGLAANSPNYEYYPGGVALVLFKRFFALQLICGFIALLHLCAENLYLGRAFPRLGTSIVVIALTLSLIGRVWMQPRMEEFRRIIYSNAPVEQKEKARHSFNVWHGVSEFANLLVLAGLLVYLVRVARPPNETIRYGTFTKFRS